MGCIVRGVVVVVVVVRGAICCTNLLVVRGSPLLSWCHAPYLIIIKNTKIEQFKDHIYFFVYIINKVNNNNINQRYKIINFLC